MLNRSLVGAAFVAALLSSTSVYADLLMTDAIPVGQGVTLYNIDPQAIPNGVGTIAGQNVFTLDANSANQFGVSTIYGWCIDLFHNISLGVTYAFTPSTLQGGVSTDNAGHTLTSTEVARMAGLMELGNYILQGAGLSEANAYFGVTGTADEWSAAIQLAIWDIEYVDNFTSLDWSNADPMTRTIYNDLIADISIVGNASDLLAVNGQQSFGYATAQLNLTSVPVPEPGTLASLGSGLLGMAGVMWWRRRRHNDHNNSSHMMAA